MFIQVVQGQVADTPALKAALDQWTRDLGPGADGWLGTTAGVAVGDEFIALVRFASAEAARRNSDRPAQHQWWMETAKLFSGAVTFSDCDQVATFLRGGSDDAGFVQVLQGRVVNGPRVLELLDGSAGPLAAFRPEIVGGTVAMHDDAFTEAVYFTDEAAARHGEGRQRPPELEAMFDEMMSLLEDVRYLDLPQPWFASPR